ncbi:MAG: hypothetical protein R3B54_19235 [Bdellovibrionota bacterium]
MNLSFSKYLDTHAERESKLLSFLEGRHWKHAVAVPARREREWLPRCLASLSRAAEQSGGKSLGILVVNGEADEAASTLRDLPLETLATGPAPLSLSHYSESLQILGVNRTGEFAFPPKQGVGLARKIGCDIALRLYAQNQLEQARVHTTDADVEVPETYFEVPHLEGVAAYLYPFSHRNANGEYDEAHDLYESFLHYYVEGLRRASSPYAFHTVGSTLILSLPHYALIRGFPKREAAEDFYVLNKLAKVGRIESLKEPLLTIRPRRSDRVPFGTGQATGKLAAALERGETYRVYDPRVFDALGAWIRGAESYCADKDRSALSATTAPFASVLDELGAYAALEVAWQTRSSETDRRRHFHTWFDGFRTLRFVHLLTERLFDKIPFSAALTGEKTLLSGLE